MARHDRWLRSRCSWFVVRDTPLWPGSSTDALALVQDLVNTGSAAREPDLLADLVLAALYEGQLAGTRMRLKTCRNPQCPLAFYDRSRNASGVWCSVRICGNAINLRAHRERRRVQGM
jgi:predicted RNA-binding Zn ribbon-like protein